MAPSQLLPAAGWENTLKFKIYRDKKNEWRWTLYAKNGRKIADSAEGYKRQGKVRRMIEKIIVGPHRIEE